MKLRKYAKNIPGVRATYRVLMRAQRRVRRVVCGPNQAERYDVETAEVLRRVLGPDSVCIDVGAHCGDILKMMVDFAPNGRHHAIEALPDLADKLATQFPDVLVHSCAVANETGEHLFNFVSDNPGFSGLRRRSYPRDDYDIHTIQVPVRRLDDLIPANTMVRLIKADIEGGEYDAFLGAQRTIKRCKPLIVFEFDQGGAGSYGISPAMMDSLLCGALRLKISTMRRWLDGAPPLNAKEFAESFQNGADFYFLAYPESTV